MELIKKLFLLQILIVKKKSCGLRCIENQTRLSKGAPSGIPVTLGMEEEFLSEDRMNKGQKAKDNRQEKNKRLDFSLHTFELLDTYWNKKKRWMILRACRIIFPHVFSET